MDWIFKSMGWIRGNSTQQKALLHGRDEMPGPEPESDAFEAQTLAELPAKKPLKINTSHRLESADYIGDPDFGGLITPKGIVIHFTCSYDLPGTVKWFKNQVVDIHLLLNKNGLFTQMVPFNRKAAHAGASKWKNYSGLNSFFLGIEVINLGPLSLKNGQYFDCYGRKYTGQVIEKKMLGYQYWEPFTQAQIDSLVDVCAELVKTYRFTTSFICGHHEASPGRKCDPGGSMTMDMSEFRRLVDERLRENKVFLTEI